MIQVSRSFLLATVRPLNFVGVVAALPWAGEATAKPGRPSATLEDKILIK